MAPRQARKRRPPPDRAELEAALGYSFRDPAWLEEALTHGSFHGAIGRRHPHGGGRDYERLEFLGDRVLGLVVAHLLFERFPTEAEGALTNRQVAMVRQESLVAVAERLGLGRWLKIAPSEAGAAAVPRPAMLADCCEAVIGAVYLDGGFAAAQAFVARSWLPLIEDLRAPPRDPKMALQEWAHARGRPEPRYRVVEASGPAHATTFTVEVAVGDSAPRTASASTKRAAERAAAALMLASVAGPSHG